MLTALPAATPPPLAVAAALIIPDAAEPAAIPADVNPAAEKYEEISMVGNPHL